MAKIQYFDVSENNVVIPSSEEGLIGDISQLIDRAEGNQIVTIKDVNGNGVPDSGDTGIDRNGDFHGNIQLSQEIIYPRFTDSLPLWARPFKSFGEKFDVRPLSLDSIEHLAIDLANSIDNYAGETKVSAREMAGEVTDDPEAAAALTAAGLVLYAIPHTRPVIQGATIVGAAAGDGYLIYDRIKGISDLVKGKADPHKMGAHDLPAVLAVLGAAPELRGMSVKEFLMAPVDAAKTIGEGYANIAISIGRMNGGLQLAGVGAAGGVIVVAGAGVLEGVAEGAVVATSAGGGLNLNSLWAVAVAATSVAASNVPAVAGGNSKVRQLVVGEGFPPVHRWKGSDAEFATEYIDVAISDIKGVPQNEIEQFRGRVDALREIYLRHPDNKVRENINKILQDILAEIEAANRQGVELGGPAGPLRRNFYTKLDPIIHDATLLENGRPFAHWGRVKIASKSDIIVPEGIKLDDGVEESVSRDPFLREALDRALDKLAKKAGDGARSGDNKNLGAGVFELRDITSGGPRVYWTEHNGKAVILRVGRKTMQQRDIDYSKERAKSLKDIGSLAAAAGFGSIFVYLGGEDSTISY